MSIIVEGMDNSGKSTLAKMLSNQLGFHVSHPGGKASNKDDAINQAYSSFADCTMNGNIIYDRVPFISACLYGNFGLNMENHTYKHLKFMLQYTRQIIVIYCRPPVRTIVDMSAHQEKDHDTDEHLEFVYKNMHKIINAYDRYFETVPHIVYDWTSMNSSDDTFDFINLVNKYLDPNEYGKFIRSWNEVRNVCKNT